MGSPNFYTGNDVLANVAIELDYEEDGCFVDDVFEQTKDAMESLQRNCEIVEGLFFHKIVISTGYHNGIQMYFESLEREDSLLEDYLAYGDVYDSNNYPYPLHDFKYANKNAKRLTAHTVKLAAKREYKYLMNLFKQFVLDNKLGVVVGRGYTSQVVYQDKDIKEYFH